jgi:phosphoserine phosphatase
MTDDEAQVLSCARQIQQYCQERGCCSCIFSSSGDCVIDSLPRAWAIDELNENELDSNSTNRVKNELKM